MQENRINRLAHRGTGGQQGWIYGINGILSAIPSSCYKDPPKIVVTRLKGGICDDHKRPKRPAPTR